MQSKLLREISFQKITPRTLRVAPPPPTPKVAPHQLGSGAGRVPWRATVPGQGQGQRAAHLVLLLPPAQEALLLELLVVGSVIGLHLPGELCG